VNLGDSMSGSGKGPTGRNGLGDQARRQGFVNQKQGGAVPAKNCLLVPERFALAMQAAGKIMEGGKLAAGDEMKYRQMLPRPGDSDDVVRQKVAGMKDFLRALAQARAKGLQESGYNVPPSLFPQGPKADPMVSVRRKADGKVLPLPKSKADTLDKDKYEVTP